MHLRSEEIEAQNGVEFVELAISFEEKVDLSEIQNNANTKRHLPSLVTKTSMPCRVRKLVPL